MEGLVGSTAFQWSGWLLTLIGTLAAFLTFFQVGRKNSAFRRALTRGAQRRAGAELEGLYQQLNTLAGKLVASSPGERATRRALEWTALSSKAIASLEAFADDPFVLGRGELARFESGGEARQSDRARIRRGISNKTNGRTAALPRSRTNSAVALRDQLEQGQLAAGRYVGSQATEDLASLKTEVHAIVGQLAYVAGRIAHSRDGEDHDDR